MQNGVKERYREVLSDAGLQGNVRDGFQYQIEFRGSLIFNLLGSTLTIYHRYTRDPAIINLLNFPSCLSRSARESL